MTRAEEVCEEVWALIELNVPRVEGPVGGPICGHGLLMDSEIYVPDLCTARCQPLAEAGPRMVCPFIVWTAP